MLGKFSIKLLIIIIIICVNSLLAFNINHEKIADLPFFRYEMYDNDTITFYMSNNIKQSNIPLVVYIQGSGSNSLFSLRNNKIIPSMGHYSWYKNSKDFARFLIIEKPGVEFLQKETSNDFNSRFCLESWCERIKKVLIYVIENENIDKNKILLAGHSEGGLVVSKVAKEMNNTVSNVAILAGGGISQLYCLYKLAEKGEFFGDEPDSDARKKIVLDNWAEILKDSSNVNKQFMGHSYLRWSSFLKTSVIDELDKYDGKILLIQGGQDKAVFPESVNIAYLDLLSKGKNVKLMFIENADHSFNDISGNIQNGWDETIKIVMEWFKE
ncbi:MAG: hypothetical protein JXR48_13440 [Candidatus Delongbacteria bacterium]|nr:hypothetical protein [Candidatus Delongbacteria bacterium]MBN2835959.1 hypothetical protein [Candidatus Delongbacteria bacterium]